MPRHYLPMRRKLPLGWVGSPSVFQPRRLMHGRFVAIMETGFVLITHGNFHERHQLSHNSSQRC